MLLSSSNYPPQTPLLVTDQTEYSGRLGMFIEVDPDNHNHVLVAITSIDGDQIESKKNLSLPMNSVLAQGDAVLLANINGPDKYLNGKLASVLPGVSKNGKVCVKIFTENEKFRKLAVPREKLSKVGRFPDKLRSLDPPTTKMISAAKKNNATINFDDKPSFLLTMSPRDCQFGHEYRYEHISGPAHLDKILKEKYHNELGGPVEYSKTKKHFFKFCSDMTAAIRRTLYHGPSNTASGCNSISKDRNTRAYRKTAFANEPEITMASLLGATGKNHIWDTPIYTFAIGRQIKSGNCVAHSDGCVSYSYAYAEEGVRLTLISFTDDKSMLANHTFAVVQTQIDGVYVAGVIDSWKDEPVICSPKEILHLQGSVTMQSVAFGSLAIRSKIDPSSLLEQVSQVAKNTYKKHAVHIKNPEFVKQVEKSQGKKDSVHPRSQTNYNPNAVNFRGEKVGPNNQVIIEPDHRQNYRRGGINAQGVQNSF